VAEVVVEVTAWLVVVLFPMLIVVVVIVVVGVFSICS